MGQRADDVSSAMRDPRSAGCDLLTITQYLRPSPRHRPVSRWVKPSQFTALQKEAEDLGFAGVLSGPLVRSSNRAGTLYAWALESRRQAIDR
jgi:lipoic acid synthetase